MNDIDNKQIEEALNSKMMKEKLGNLGFEENDEIFKTIHGLLNTGLFKNIMKISNRKVEKMEKEILNENDPKKSKELFSNFIRFFKFSSEINEELNQIVDKKQELNKNNSEILEALKEKMSEILN